VKNNKPQKSMSRATEEFELAWKEFFKNKPKPKNDQQEKKELEDFTNWYNNVRKQSDTEKTPAEMYKEIYGKEPKEASDVSKPSRMMNFEWDENYKEPDELLYEADQLCIDGKYQEALNNVEQVLEIIPDDEESLLLKSQILPYLNRAQEAENILNNISKRLGKSTYWYFYRAGLSFWHGNIAHAIESIKEAVKKEPNNFDVLVSAAQYLYLDKDESYKSYLQKAIEIDEKRLKNFEKKYWIGQKELIKGPFLISALDTINDLLEKNKTLEVRKNIAFLIKYEKELPKDIIDIILGLEVESYFIDNNFENVETKIDALINRNKNNPHAYFYKAQFLFENGDLGNALEEIDKCLEIAERKIPHPDFYLLKSMILKKQDDDSYLYYENKAKELRKGMEKMGEFLEDFK
jgi:tetratricopeptide (TPR) repeat protein